MKAFVRQQWRYLAVVLAALLILAVALPGLLIHLERYPALWLDEGFSINAARTWLDFGQYGTYTSAGLRPFDPSISTGFPVITALTLSFKVLGVSAFAARFTIVLFTLAALAGLMAVVAQTGGRQTARMVFITLFVITFPAPGETNFMLLGRQVLGENPSIAFMLIALLLWWRSWQRSQLWVSLLCGLLLGLSLLTKLQVAMPLVLAILCVALIRAARSRVSLWRGLLPLVTAAGVYVLWTLIAQLGTPEALRSDNRQIMLEGARIHFFSGLFAAKFDRTVLLIWAMIALAAGWVGWQRLRRSVEPQAGTTVSSTQGTLALLVALGTVWAAVFSIGWPRYYYSSLILSLVITGDLVWRTLFMVSLRLTRNHTRTAERIMLMLSAGLILLLMNLHVLSNIHQAAPNYAEQMSTYIDAQVERGAVIETWDWQAAALSQHRLFHHPGQLMMWEALHQYSRERRFNLEYDMLQADPAYLLLGPFSAWTGIYDVDTVRERFALEAEFGPYQLYRRVQ